MHHRYLTKRFVTASIFSPLPKQNQAAIGAQLFIGTAASAQPSWCPNLVDSSILQTGCRATGQPARRQAPKVRGSLRGSTASLWSTEFHPQEPPSQRPGDASS